MDSGVGRCSGDFGGHHACSHAQSRRIALPLVSVTSTRSNSVLISVASGPPSCSVPGMMRDLVLGIEAVLADGTVISSLNKMLKNNAGYDLKHLKNS
jgi:hypothetical protein